MMATETVGTTSINWWTDGALTEAMKRSTWLKKQVEEKELVRLLRLLPWGRVPSLHGSSPPSRRAQRRKTMVAGPLSVNATRSRGIGLMKIK
jgi:hypothetical protein